MDALRAESTRDQAENAFTAILRRLFQNVPALVATVFVDMEGECIDYVTCLDLGPSDAVFTRGWEGQVELSGDQAKAMKREINTKWIYPPPANRADAYKAAEWARLVDY